MAKTSIAILQEYAAKLPYELPNYIFIGDQVISGNEHVFTIRVKYKSLSADGRGSTKQKAKHEAAQEMLRLLGTIPSTNRTNPIQSLPNSLNIVNNNSLQQSGQQEINYIGLLQELCAKKGMILPKYEETNATGPHHQMNFTVKCKILDIEKNGYGKTKKIAKLEAAKKVWLLCQERLNLYKEEKVEESEFGLNIEEINIEDILPEYKGENNLAVERYLKLTKLTVTPLLAESVNIENCHRVFTSEQFSTNNRKKIINLLSSMCTGTENSAFVEKYFNILQQIAKILNADLKPMNLNLNRFAKSDNAPVNYAVGYKLYTSPTISAIGDGTTMASARLKAILNIKTSLTLLFC
ncbi:RISC-loading complex subunit tarbp2-like [Leptopilina heterotoma]|uniref:RISC-loading complex subunit tarbp2-like n=1 Tax=Leptopilina heterotoma TaxID=63436 RepID=UPI001CA8FFA9|nr:RISC-loading complex subunit tarbp2-like [Leptopilina heterotoma]XP_043463093.1 RISC-loading complex subunit tarbp2-like [Leptopilina heterotoma]